MECTCQNVVSFVDLEAMSEKDQVRALSWSCEPVNGHGGFLSLRLKNVPTTLKTALVEQRLVVRFIKVSRFVASFVPATGKTGPMTLVWV